MAGRCNAVMQALRERLARPSDSGFTARTVLRLSLLVGVAGVVTAGVIAVVLAALTHAVGSVA